MKKAVDIYKTGWYYIKVAEASKKSGDKKLAEKPIKSIWRGVRVV